MVDRLTDVWLAAGASGVRVRCSGLPLDCQVGPDGILGPTSHRVYYLKNGEMVEGLFG